MLIALALAVVLAVLAVYFLVLRRRAIRERIAITEFAQFLLLNPKSYGDHREKFLDYLADTGQRSPAERGRDAQLVVENMARGMFDKVVLGNVAARNAVVVAASKSLTS